MQRGCVDNDCVRMCNEICIRMGSAGDKHMYCKDMRVQAIPVLLGLEVYTGRALRLAADVNFYFSTVPGALLTQTSAAVLYFKFFKKATLTITLKIPHPFMKGSKTGNQQLRTN